MTTPDDDWQKRIENGGSWADPGPGYPPPPSGGTADSRPPGPVYGAPSTGHPPPGFPPLDATQQFAAVPGYGYAPADAGAPYGRDPVTGEPLSDKSKVAAGLLQILLGMVGVCGVGRLYTGSTNIGLAQLLLFWVGFPAMFLLVGFLIVPAVWIWAFVDGILMLTGAVRDGQGRKLRD
ncbi:TM2 domain-containing protein [Rhodococcus sp. NPDC058505]|uniref:TM2 domain-containing protein n=1 Tax=unclassified Rhodococcus (in: high G+C Gram-positive bacteria) TaxID=192944 RepID=UPI0036605BBC